MEVFCKKVFLKIPQNLQEHTCVTVSYLIMLQLLESLVNKAASSGVTGSKPGQVRFQDFWAQALG